MKTERRIYLDYNATTPLRPEVLEVMIPYLKDHFGNPSSLHHFGQEAKRAMEDARESIAYIIRSNPSEIVFTGGGTAADNLAIKGVAREEIDLTVEALRNIVDRLRTGSPLYADQRSNPT